MRLPCLLLLAAVVPAAAADEKLPPNAQIVRLTASPAAVSLSDPYGYTQLVVSAQLASGDIVDVTRLTTLTAPASVSVTPAGIVRPAADGTGELVASLNGQTLKVPVTVSQAKTVRPVSFVQDVQPILSKLGCNQGTCHGAQAGKNGFKLSLRGYDPLYDHRALTDDLEGRRFNRAAPDRSLMLMKPAGAVPHAGGVVWQPGDPSYEVVKQWIADGVTLDLQAPRVTAIEVLPKNPTVQVIGAMQQFRVIASFADGKKRDITAEAFLESSNTDVAAADKGGLMTSVRRGEATMLARYEGAYDASTVVVMGDRAGFAWQDRPQLNHIDALVDAKLKKMRIQANGLCDDAEFVRRVHLDLTGLPPTSEQTRAFLADTTESRAKREKLIDQLVGGDAYVEHWTNKWADMLQVNRKFLGEPGAKALRQWIHAAIQSNKPYDQFCYDILTASGSNVENPPAAYYKVLRDAESVMENTTQLFLAVRFNCNKCHDHPFEKWTQDQYYQTAAFFSRVALKEDPKFKGQKIGGTAVEGAKPLAEVIEDKPAGDILHARTGAVAPPTFPYPVDGAAADGKLPRRVQAAKWITSPKNPYFARSYVNRVWSYLTGVGIIEPVDDIRAGNPATNPDLLDRLTTDFISSGFDVRKLVTTICKSRTYQLDIAADKWNKDDETNYSRAVARRLPAEVLYDSVYRATGSVTRLPGMPAGARAAQLLDSNVELPGGFLELLGKPVRESACECERSSGMMLGPVLAFVSGPVVGDAVQDPNNHIARFTLKEKDDAKVVEEVYLSILNRFPTDAEVKAGVTAVRSAGQDHTDLVAIHKQRVVAFEQYKTTLDAKQTGWEAGLREQKPTAWTPLTVKSANTKAGPNPGSAKPADTLKVQPDGSVLATGPVEAMELYTVVAETTQAKPITGLRLEALADPSLPKKGPGRAENGNFVLHELKVNWRPADKADEKPKPVKLNTPQATFSQDGFPIANAIDNNNGTGWAIAPQLGIDHAAVFRLQGGVNAPKGAVFTFVLEQRFGSGHTLGKFRLSVTTDKNPALQSPVSKELAALLDVPTETRTPAQQDDLRRRYLAQDGEYQRLAADAAKVPPTDPRVLGAQDLTWALINTPSFLFNR